MMMIIIIIIIIKIIIIIIIISNTVHNNNNNADDDDELGGVSMNTAKSIKILLGERQGKSILRRMQKSKLSHTLNIARSFKVLMSPEPAI